MLAEWAAAEREKRRASGPSGLQSTPAQALLDCGHRILLKVSRSPILGDRPSPPEQRKCYQQDACAFEIIGDRRLR
jgi:hypothetical protein